MIQVYFDIERHEKKWQCRKYKWLFNVCENILSLLILGRASISKNRKKFPRNQNIKSFRNMLQYKKKIIIKYFKNFNIKGFLRLRKRNNETWHLRYKQNTKIKWKNVTFATTKDSNLLTPFFDTFYCVYFPFTSSVVLDKCLKKKINTNITQC